MKRKKERFNEKEKNEQRKWGREGTKNLLNFLNSEIFSFWRSCRRVAASFSFVHQKGKYFFNYVYKI